MVEYMLVDTAVAYPGQCVCGNQSRPLVDTHIELVGGQRVYLCERCVRRSAQLLGMGPVEPLERQLAERDGRIIELETELADARPVLDAIARAAH